MNYLQNLRKSLNLTQTDVVKMTGISKTAISFYENGKRLPTVKQAKKLGDALHFDWTKLFERSEDDRPELQEENGNEEG